MNIQLTDEIIRAFSVFVVTQVAERPKTVEDALKEAEKVATFIKGVKEDSA